MIGSSRDEPAATSPDAMPAPRPIGLPERVVSSGNRERALTLPVHESGRGPAVVLCDGFPELACSWRHQIPLSPVPAST